MSREQEEKKDRVRGWVTTLSVHAVLLLAFAFLGLTYSDPPVEMGIPVSFGYEEDGGGDDVAAPSEPVTETSTSTPVTPTDVPDVATQDQVETVAVPSEDRQEPQETQPDPQQQTTTPDPVVQEPEPEPEPQRPSNRLSGALNRASQAQNNPSTGSGQGTTQGGGDQGAPTGGLNSQGQGLGGTGNSGDYQLGNRAATERPKPRYDCDGQGKVVVKIYVNRYGKVVRAEGGQAGSTAPQCLIDRAEAAAMKTKWEGDPGAPELQVGQITYRFKRN